MQDNHRELWYAFIAVIFITLLYAFVSIVWADVPAASGFFGHTLGILGFLLMLMTEILYTLRKRSRSARWGRMSSWLQFHIFTGLVGPFMVLLHSSWKFNGLAGVVTLLTAIIVLSGFFGRYVYTSIPRTVEGMEMDSGEVSLHQADLDAAVNSWISTPELQKHPGLVKGIISGEISRRHNARLWRSARRSLSEPARTQFDTLSTLVQRRDHLRRQVDWLERARRLLGIWHTVHIPIGIALFTMAFIHIAAAIYYATLLK
jgi:hypothetical protein